MWREERKGHASNAIRPLCGSSVDGVTPTNPVSWFLAQTRFPSQRFPWFLGWGSLPKLPLPIQQQHELYSQEKRKVDDDMSTPDNVEYSVVRVAAWRIMCLAVGSLFVAALLMFFVALVDMFSPSRMIEAFTEERKGGHNVKAVEGSAAVPYEIPEEYRVSILSPVLLLPSIFTTIAIFWWDPLRGVKSKEVDVTRKRLKPAAVPGEDQAWWKLSWQRAKQVGFVLFFKPKPSERDLLEAEAAKANTTIPAAAVAAQ